MAVPQPGPDPVLSEHRAGVGSLPLPLDFISILLLIPQIQ